MSRILLVHWNAKEAKQRARHIASLGHQVATLHDSEKPNLFAVRRSPPELFVIDLTRLPSHGREIAGYFRRGKVTRQVPILFVDGDADRRERAPQLIPDAEFADAARIEPAIKKAIRNAPANPVVPGTMAGYSGTPLPKKLGVSENSLVLLVNAPARFERKLEPLPAGARLSENAADANVVVLFASSQGELARLSSSC